MRGILSKLGRWLAGSSAKLGVWLADLLPEGKFKAYIKKRLRMNVDQHVGKRVSYDHGVRREKRLPISDVAGRIGNQGLPLLNLPPNPKMGRPGQYAIDAKSNEIAMQATARGYFKDWADLGPDQVTEDMRKAVTAQILADLKSGGLKNRWGDKS